MREMRIVSRHFRERAPSNNDLSQDPGKKKEREITQHTQWSAKYREQTKAISEGKKGKKIKEK